jgi:hypothetical protein
MAKLSEWHNSRYCFGSFVVATFRQEIQLRVGVVLLRVIIMILWYDPWLPRVDGMI